MLRILTGTVTSDKMEKTISVKIASTKKHKLYRKNYPSSKKYLVDDPKNEAHIGDKVSIIECRPISAKKYFRLHKIIQKAKLSMESLAILKNQTELTPNKSKKSDQDIPQKQSKSDNETTKES